jgi:hypothetical protein
LAFRTFLGIASFPRAMTGGGSELLLEPKTGLICWILTSRPRRALAEAFAFGIHSLP